MNKIVIIISAWLAFMGLAVAQSITTMTVSYPSGTDTVSGYLAMPKSGGKHPFSRIRQLI